VNYGHLPDEASRVALVGIVDSISLAPAIYWIGIPALAIAVEAIAVHTGRPLRFHRSLLGMLGVLGIVSFGAEFFTFSSHGREIAFDNGLLVAILIVAVLPILGSLALAAESVKSGSFRLRTPLLAGLLAGLVLLTAAATSLVAVIWPIVRFIETTFDTSVNLDSSLDLAGTSFHEGIMGMVIGAGILGAIAGAHHWGHKMWGRALDDRLGMASTVAAAAGGIVWGVGQVVAGILGQQRLPMVDPGAPGGVEALNAVSAVGLALLALAVLALLGNLVRAALGRGSSNEPWRGYSLEWSTASPPPPANFAVPPVVRSTNPLADPEFLTANQATLTAGQATETEPA
jgi:heme/copper-type cytochrome/quinol oxidase subunit 1